MMIIKNEENIIIRCLESCLPIIDFVFITDTGSTDNTIKITNEWISKKKTERKLIDGEVILGNKFENFGKSRNESFINAKRELNKRDIINNTYLLLMDADMILKIKSFDKSQLIEDSYNLLQIENVGDVYQNIRLLNANRKWECKCVTHEFWRDNSLFASTEIKLFKELYILDLSDGNNKEDKYNRDLNLLLEAIEKETEQGIKQRYAFYIARTYYSLKKYTESLEWFNKRISLGGWVEEIFYSKFMIGKINSLLYHYSNDIKFLHDARNAFLDSWLYRPTRAEPIYWLCVTEMNLNLFDDHKFITQKNALVFMYCNYISKLKIPNDVLFIETDVYVWKIKYLLYISSFYVQDRDIGNKTFEELKSINMDERYRKSILTFRQKYKW